MTLGAEAPPPWLLAGKGELAEAQSWGRNVSKERPKGMRGLRVLTPRSEGKGIRTQDSQI